MLFNIFVNKCINFAINVLKNVSLISSRYSLWKMLICPRPTIGLLFCRGIISDRRCKISFCIIISSTFLSLHLLVIIICNLTKEFDSWFHLFALNVIVIATAIYRPITQLEEKFTRVAHQEAAEVPSIVPFHLCQFPTVSRSLTSMIREQQTAVRRPHDIILVCNSEQNTIIRHNNVSHMQIYTRFVCLEYMHELNVHLYVHVRLCACSFVRLCVCG